MGELAGKCRLTRQWWQGAWGWNPSQPWKEFARHGNSWRNQPISQGLAELVSAGQWPAPEAGPQAAPHPPLEVMEPRAGWQREDHMGLGMCRLWLWPASPWRDKRSQEQLQGGRHHPSRGWRGQLPLCPHLGASPPSESHPRVLPEHSHPAEIREARAGEGGKD